MEAKWTKGPWTFEAFSFGSPDAPVSHKKIVGPVEPDTSRKLIAEVHMKHDTHEADGRLIASAPMLYEALLNTTQTLRLMLAGVPDYPQEARQEVRREIAEAEAALRAARGGQ